MSNREVMIGNYAIALGLVEAGIDLAAAYPGTPSSEILPGIVEFKGRKGRDIHIEWSVNERIALEVAFGAALAGKKAVCMMKQVGLNVAFPGFLKGRDLPLKGAMVIVSCDDPGPQSSQTEQDSRLAATLFGVPVFDPSSPSEARLCSLHAVSCSGAIGRPVIIRSTHRVSHAREAISLVEPRPEEVILEEGRTVSADGRLGIVASGMSYNVAMDVLDELRLNEAVSVFKAAGIFPPSPDLLDFVRSMERVLVLEETDEVLEAMAGNLSTVFGRRNGFVPRQGELTYDVVREIVQKAAEEAGMVRKSFVYDTRIDEAIKTVPFPPRPPKLCAGCPHRSAFYAMKQAFPRALFTGDIGCYTLGMAQGAVDTFIDMGGSVSLASGFYDAFNQDGLSVPIVGSIGDSTFFHAALPLLYDAAQKGKRFILVIMDNGTTAMTGMQPTPQSGMRAEGRSEYAIPIEQVVKGLGVQFLRILDPYKIPAVMEALKEAAAFMSETGRGPAVIITRRPCILLSKGGKKDELPYPDLTTSCTGCKRCIRLFDCPAFLFDESEKKVRVDEGLCVKCGICLLVCPEKK